VDPEQGRPADACPYHRPFADDFDECPAYAARRFIPFDSLHRPLNPIWTCSFLAPRRAADKAHGYYASCGLGTFADRQAWVDTLRKERLESVVRLQREASNLAQPYLTRVWAAKARQVADAAAEGEATAELKSLLARMEAEILAFIDDHRDDLETAGLPVEACKELVRLTLRDLLEQQTLGSPNFEAPRSLIEQFPADLQPLLFQPAAPAS
jgi:hypothetical protein